MPRTPQSDWGVLFNFAGAGIVHMELFEVLLMSLNNPTLFESITAVILLHGTHALRPTAANAPLNALYIESDTGEGYQNQAGTWVLVFTAGAAAGVASLVATAPLSADAATGDVTLTHDDTAVTPATYGDATHVAQITVDQQGHITAAAEVEITGGGGGGPGWTLVEKKLITTASQDETFSGLDGNTDQVYKLIARVKNTAGADCTFTLRPNNATTNLYSAEFFAYSSTTVSQTSTDLRIWALNNNVWAQAEILLHASAAPNGVAAQRLYQARTAWLTPTPVGVIGEVGGGWNETSANITSLVIHASVASGIGAGSELCLYKLAQA